MTAMPLPCDPAKLPSIDDLVPFIHGALDAAAYQRRTVTRFHLAKHEGAWTLISGRPTEVTAPHHLCLSARAVMFAPARVAEVARDLIDGYHPLTA